MWLDTSQTYNPSVVLMASARSGAPSPLLAGVRQQPRLLHYSDRTAQSYVAWIVRYIRFHGTFPLHGIPLYGILT